MNYTFEIVLLDQSDSQQVMALTLSYNFYLLTLVLSFQLFFSFLANLNFLSSFIPQMIMEAYNQEEKIYSVSLFLLFMDLTPHLLYNLLCYCISSEPYQLLNEFYCLYVSKCHQPYPP